jgi:hypothetical protein
MAETDAFPLEPDYAITENWTEGVLRSQSMGRKEFSRLVAPPQRGFHLVFKGRPSSDKETLITWYRKFEASWFRFDYATYLVEAAAYLSRSFPVAFAGPPKIEFASNECYDMECDLVEAVGRALPTSPNKYPTFSDGHPYVAVANGFASGSDLVLVYGGYGFRTVNGGTYVITLDGTSLGAAPITKTDVPLGLHRVIVTGGGASTAYLEVLI